MSIALYRIDDRLIHGQVVVGWGKRLNVGFIVLVDDAVRASTWEQELYRMGVPPDIDVVFASTAEALTCLPEGQRGARGRARAARHFPTPPAHRPARRSPARAAPGPSRLGARAGPPRPLPAVGVPPARAPHALSGRHVRAS